ATTTPPQGQPSCVHAPPFDRARDPASCLAPAFRAASSDVACRCDPYLRINRYHRLIAATACVWFTSSVERLRCLRRRDGTFWHHAKRTLVWTSEHHTQKQCLTPGPPPEHCPIGVRTPADIERKRSPSAYARTNSASGHS